MVVNHINMQLSW